MRLKMYNETPGLVYSTVMRSKIMALTVKKILFVSILFLVGAGALAEEISPAEEIRNWLAAPDMDNFSNISHLVNSLDTSDLLSLVRDVDGYLFTQQVALTGLVAKHERFGSISKDCISNSNDVERAACITALHEWKKQRGIELSESEQNKAINLLNSKNTAARKLVVLTLFSIDYYSPRAFNTALEIIETDLSKQPFGDDIKNSYIQFLEVITDTDVTNLGESSKVNYYKDWLKTNEHLLKPSKLNRKGRLSYTNYLHRFTIELPISYKRVYDSKFVKGKRCFFADPNGRSIAVETHPKKGSIDIVFKEVERNSGAVKYKELVVGKYPAIKYKIEVNRGTFIGVLIVIEDRTILATAYSPLNSDSINTVEGLINGLSIL